MDSDHRYLDNSRPELQRLVPESACALLDVGCHQGAFGLAMKQRGVEQVWGVEADPQTAAVASQRLDRVLVGFFDAVELPDVHFDVVTFNDVLEHMVDPAGALRIAAAKLKPGGWVVASLPNLRNYNNLMHILREKDFRYEESGIRDRTHLRFFTEKSIVRLFEQSGFTVVSLTGINEDWWSQAALLRRLLFRLFPSYLRDTRHMQFAVVATPATERSH